MDTEYFNKISAIEFAVKHDDGKSPQGFLESDLVLLGVSRTSKTPLSIFLANKVDKRRMIGLVCEPEKLVKIRSNRLNSLGLSHSTSYTDLEKIYQELDYSKEVFRKYQTEVINITDKSIEETAFLIEDYLKKLDIMSEAK